MPKLKELSLDSGYVVRCRPVPPLLTQGVMTKSEYQYPAPPTIDVSVQKGRATETVPAPTDSPEMEEFIREFNKVEEARNNAAQRFTFSYGCVEWKEEGEERFLKHPPKGWNPDTVMKDVFGEDASRRDIFIMGVLIATTGDLEKIQRAIMPSERELISGGEVEAAADSFPGDVQGDEPSGAGSPDNE